MKKIFHKNQIVITTLAVLIAIAGYVSYDRKNGHAEEEAQIVANTDVLNNETDLALEISDEEEGVQFFLADDGTLQLMNKNTKDVYKTFVPAENGMVGYRVRDVFTANPENIFFEINATIGAHEQNCGYWLIGKENGQWVTYVALEDLAKNGYAIDQWRQIVTKINTDGSGRFILLSQYEYMPPEATFGMQRRYFTDLQLELLWDDTTQGVVMRRL